MIDFDYFQQYSEFNYDNSQTFVTVFNCRDEAEHEDVPVAQQDAQGLRGARRHHQGEDGGVPKGSQAEEGEIRGGTRGLQQTGETLRVNRYNHTS